MNDFIQKVRTKRRRWFLWTTLSIVFLLLMSSGFTYIVAHYIGIGPTSFDMYALLFITAIIRETDMPC